MANPFLEFRNAAAIVAATGLAVLGTGCGGSPGTATSDNRDAANLAVAAAPAGATTPRGPSGDGPPPARLTKDGPVGLYFMTRYRSGTGSLEKAAWFFAPDGTVYQNIAGGFSDGDLGTHDGPKGKRELAGGTLTVTWSDGTATESDLEPDGESFAWDGGIFTPVRPLRDGASIAGSYEGGESLSTSAGGGTGSGSAVVSKSLELRPDGTYSTGSAASLASESRESQVLAGATGGAEGTWKLDGYSMTLAPASGEPTRGIAFPYDDEETPVYPDRMFFRGTMYKKR